MIFRHALTPYQLDLIGKVIAVLNPIEEITKSISTDAASVSLIIPFIRALRRTLKIHDNDRGVQTMKGDMLTSLNRRYIDVESNSPLVLATLLDPRFKDKFFSGTQKRAFAKELLDQMVAEFTHSVEPREPSPKLPKAVVLKCFSEILEEAGVEVDSKYNTVVDKYLSKPLIPFHRGSAYKWWAENRVCFKPLADLAIKYLSSPPTSVPSERLFSRAGDIYDEKRNHLAPERAEMLLLIKNNFTLVGGSYKYSIQ